MCEILIVEDDLLIALDIELMMEDAGYTVVGVATTEDQAVAMAAVHHPKLMIVDLRLADGSRGPDAVDRIRKTQSIEVIFASGNLDPDTRNTLRRFHPIAMISKPFMGHQLENAVATVV